MNRWPTPGNKQRCHEISLADSQQWSRKSVFLFLTWQKNVEIVWNILQVWLLHGNTSGGSVGLTLSMHTMHT